jgi:hypothetical protein
MNFYFPFSERVIMLPHIKVMEAMLVLVNACHNVAIEWLCLPLHLTSNVFFNIEIVYCKIILLNIRSPSILVSNCMLVFFPRTLKLTLCMYCYPFLFKFAHVCAQRWKYSCCICFIAYMYCTHFLVVLCLWLSGSAISTATIPITRSCLAKECWGRNTNQEIQLSLHAYIQERRW